MLITMEWRPGWSRALQQLWQDASAVWLWKGRLQETKKTTYWQTMLDAHKVAQRASNFQTIKTDVWHANNYATGALLSRNFAFSLSLFPLAAKGWV